MTKNWGTVTQVTRFFDTFVYTQMAEMAIFVQYFCWKPTALYEIYKQLYVAFVRTNIRLDIDDVQKRSRFPREFGQFRNIYSAL